ncbi:MAG TPA: guanitoxin biosynthesis pre-guanitoxin forming N-methyltransferase GntF [Steroidobacteraceae bacterium]
MADGISVSPAVADYSQWQARDYFKTYYSEVVLPDEQVVLKYQIEALRQTEHKFGRGLEYGCGPTLHRAIAAARYAFRLDMADWLPDNLQQVRAWMDASSGNGDWNRFTQYILGCEGDSCEPRRIERREEHTRKVIRNLYVSDARWRHPLGAERHGFYDLLVSGFCLDAVSSDKRIWQRCMRNVLSTLHEGGLLILHSLYRCKAYKVAEQMFPGADVSEDDLVESLLHNGFSRSSIDVHVIACPDNARYGYAGILVASARKG